MKQRAFGTLLSLAGMSLGALSAIGFYRERKATGAMATPAISHKVDLSKFDGLHEAATRLSATLGTGVGLNEYLPLVAEMRTQLDLIDENSLEPAQKKLYSFYRGSTDDYSDAAVLWRCTNDAAYVTVSEFPNSRNIAVLNNFKCIIVANRHDIPIKVQKGLRTVAWPSALQDIWTFAEWKFGKAERCRTSLAEGSICND